jgi:hypothetical protein
MTNGTGYDGYERITTLVQGRLAEGEEQNRYQLGDVYKGSFHTVKIPDAIKNYPWIIHTHGKIEHQNFHPPSLQDVLMTVQNTANNPDYRGVSIVVAPEGFYILYPNRRLLDYMLTDIGFDKSLASDLKKEYPKVFDRVISSRCYSPDEICSKLKEYNIHCYFIARSGDPGDPGDPDHEMPAVLDK